MIRPTLGQMKTTNITIPTYNDVDTMTSRRNMADQAERSFQKQPTIFLNRKKGIGKKKKKKRSVRYVRNVGLGFKTPREAQTGTYIDKKCPFTGDVLERERMQHSGWKQLGWCSNRGGGRKEKKTRKTA
jgi:hypothetical protein